MALLRDGRCPTIVSSRRSYATCLTGRRRGYLILWGLTDLPLYAYHDVVRKPVAEGTDERQGYEEPSQFVEFCGHLDSRHKGGVQSSEDREGGGYA